MSKYKSNEEFLEAIYSGKEEAPAEQSDAVNAPSHYKDGGVETIDFIEAKKLGYNLGNAVKYISRAGKKDASKTKQDLEKAAWYLAREISTHNS